MSKMSNHDKKKSILVIGDIMLDTYFKGEVNRISPEAPVPVFRKVSTRYVPGGAANVAINLAAAKQKVSLMSIVGDDEEGKILKRMLDEQGVNTNLITVIKKRKTTVKTRCLGENNQQLIRLDTEETDELSAEDCKKMLNTFEKQVVDYEMLILSDYLKGFLSYEFTQGVISIAKENGVFVFADVKGSYAEKYQYADLLKPNIKELAELTAMSVLNENDVVDAANKLIEKCHCKYILTTCGAKGMVLVGTEKPHLVRASAKEVYDVTGAGDTTIAYLAACIMHGYSMIDAVEVANYAAGIQVGKVGTSPVYWWEVQDYILNETKTISKKLLLQQQLENFRQSHSQQKIVFTNGCFDILHRGHVQYLREAAEMGDLLVVGLNSDASVKRLKGETRPINGELDRAEMLCALEFVDYVAIFQEDTPLEIIKIIQPDILVKGEDYKGEYVVGTKEVEERGGKLILVPFLKGRSTTDIISKISNLYTEENYGTTGKTENS